MYGPNFTELSIADSMKSPWTGLRSRVYSVPFLILRSLYRDLPRTNHPRCPIFETSKALRHFVYHLAQPLAKLRAVARVVDACRKRKKDNMSKIVAAVLATLIEML